jgi:S-adenosylmethionine:tRNA ribosyltransferase-isomerase
MPSAGRPLTWGLLAALRARGVRLAALTHAAGLSASGDPTLDAALPLPERYDLPESTAQAVRDARAPGGRVVAVGTTVVRALEGAARNGLRAGEGVAELRIGPGFEPRVVNAVLSGMHEAGESHYELLRALVPDELLRRAAEAASDYLAHEFGDSCLVLPPPRG